MEIVKVKWTDAETYGGSEWTKLDEGIEQANISPPIMESVGWVLVKKPEYIAITSDIGPEECGHITKIPTSMIVEIENLH